MPTDPNLKGRGRVKKWRTIQLPGNRIRHIAIVSKEGPRGGHTVAGAPAHVPKGGSSTAPFPKQQRHSKHELKRRARLRAQVAAERAEQAKAAAKGKKLTRKQLARRLKKRRQNP